MRRPRQWAGGPLLALLRRFGVLGARLFRPLTAAAALAIIVLFALILILLADGSRASFSAFGFSFLAGRSWNPNGLPGYPVDFGALPFIYGTLVTSLIAMLIGIPLSLGIAIFLSELSPGWLRGPLSFVIELLAAVPSVVYGLWGLIVLVPVMKLEVEPTLFAVFGGVPVLGPLFSPPASGFLGLGYFTAGVILAIMVIPTIAAVSREAFLAVPTDQREAALSLGATGWETTRLSVLPFARRGILGAITLALGRAVGETIAVTMMIGNADRISGSLFAPGQSIASKIANEFTEAVLPLEKSALLELGLVLLLISLLINVGARLLIHPTKELEEGHA